MKKTKLELTQVKQKLHNLSKNLDKEKQAKLLVRQAQLIAQLDLQVQKALLQITDLKHLEKHLKLYMQRKVIKEFH